MHHLNYVFPKFLCLYVITINARVFCHTMTMICFFSKSALTRFNEGETTCITKTNRFWTETNLFSAISFGNVYHLNLFFVFVFKFLETFFKLCASMELATRGKWVLKLVKLIVFPFVTKTMVTLWCKKKLLEIAWL